MKHRSYVEQLPKPKYVNPQDSPFLHVVPIKEDGRVVGYEYSQAASPVLKIVLARVSHKKPVDEFEPLEELVIGLLPALPKARSLEDLEPILEQYDVKTRAIQVVRQELFNSRRENYLPRKLSDIPSANLLVLTHGRIWNPEVETAILEELKQHKYVPEEDIFHLHGRIIETNALVIR